MIKSVEWTESGVRILDQTLLPAQEVYRCCADYLEVSHAIRSMMVRGAPAIGIAAAMGVALGMRAAAFGSVSEMDARFEEICSALLATRPTAVNLPWAVSRMKDAYARSRTLGPAAVSALIAEAESILAEDLACNRAIGSCGQSMLPDHARVLTHCNTGALATAGHGTALGIVRSAVESGKHVEVYACETRPLLQGARLTVWELARDGIPVTLIPDSMAGTLMRQRKVDAVLVGADRVAANGDVANKIGTYPLAVLAKENGVPFYVAAPTSTVDLSLPDGEGIPIEERHPDEVRGFAGVRVAPPQVPVVNYAFDVTPHRYIAAIVTECGAARPPFDESLERAVICAKR